MGGGGSVLAWNDWIYHVPSKRHEVQSLHAEAAALHHSINAEVAYFNSQLSRLKQLTSGNAALAIIIKSLTFNDLQMQQLVAELQALPDPPKGSIPATFGRFIAEITGSFLVLKGIVNISKLAKSSLFRGDVVSEGAEASLKSLAEIGAELGIEAHAEIETEVGVESALAEADTHIIADVGVHLILAAINETKVGEPLDNHISKLRGAVEKLHSANTALVANRTKLEAVAVEEQTRFKALVVALQQIIPYKNAPKWGKLTPTVNALPTFMAAQKEAIRFYGLLSQLRVTYIRAKKRVPRATKEAIISAVLLKAKGDVTYDQLEQLWEILEKYSCGMRILFFPYFTNSVSKVLCQSIYIFYNFVISGCSSTSCMN